MTNMEFEVKIFGCRGGLFFTDDTYRTGEEGAIEFLSEVTNAGYMGTINDVKYVMNYQTGSVEPKA